MDIKDKVIIVTGASSGIGEATAKLLATQGAKVVLAARSADILKDLEKQLPNSFALPTDMRKPADITNLIDQTLKKFGRVDVLINDAGQGLYGPVEAIDIVKYQQVIELNIYGPLRAMQAVIPVMRKQGGGMILNISSRVSKNYFPFLAAYASTKYALNALSLTARAELEPDHIIVSVFHPKMTDTNFGKNSMTTALPGQTGGRGGSAGSQLGSRPVPEIDTPEQVAEKIFEQIKSEQPEAQM